MYTYYTSIQVYEKKMFIYKTTLQLLTNNVLLAFLWNKHASGTLSAEKRVISGFLTAFIFSCKKTKNHNSLNFVLCPNADGQRELLIVKMHCNVVHVPCTSIVDGCQNNLNQYVSPFWLITSTRDFFISKKRSNTSYF